MGWRSQPLLAQCRSRTSIMPSRACLLQNLKAKFSGFFYSSRARAPARKRNNRRKSQNRVRGSLGAHDGVFSGDVALALPVTTRAGFLSPCRLRPWCVFMFSSAASHEQPFASQRCRGVEATGPRKRTVDLTASRSDHLVVPTVYLHACFPVVAYLLPPSPSLLASKLSPSLTPLSPPLPHRHPFIASRT